MNQHEVYLKAELGKLKNKGDAESLLSQVSHNELGQLGLALSPEELVAQFLTQGMVDGFIDNMNEEQQVTLAALLSEKWRCNDVYQKLCSHNEWAEIEAGTADINISYAEKELHELWRQHDFNLVKIANDKRLREFEPYKHYATNAIITFKLCLAVKNPEGRYKIFDGVHRAIQMYFGGEHTFTLFCAMD